MVVSAPLSVELDPPACCCWLMTETEIVELATNLYLPVLDDNPYPGRMDPCRVVPGTGRVSSPLGRHGYRGGVKVDRKARWKLD
jgi:hypothetical protein